MQNIKSLLPLILTIGISACGGGGYSENTANTSTIDQRTSIASTEIGSTCTNSYSQYPSTQITNWCAITSTILRKNASGINLTSYYKIKNYNGNNTYHNGIDFQSTDIGGKDCAKITCPEYSVYLPISAQVVDIFDNYGAIRFKASREVNGIPEEYYFTFIHMKNYSHISPGQFLPAGTIIGTQWATGANGSEHVHLEFQKTSTPGLLSGTVYDSNGLDPKNYITLLKKLALQMSDFAIQSAVVKRVSVKSGTGYIGSSINYLVEGKNLPPSAHIKLFKKGTSDTSIANCTGSPIVRGNNGTFDFFEQKCTLDKLGAYELKVFALDGEIPLITKNGSILPRVNVLGFWGQLEGKTYKVGLSGSDLPQIANVSSGNVPCALISSSSTTTFQLYDCIAPPVPQGQNTVTTSIDIIGKKSEYSFSIHGGMLSYSLEYWLYHYGSFYSTGLDNYRYYPQIGEKISIRVNYEDINGGVSGMPGSTYFSSVQLTGSSGTFTCTPSGAPFTFTCPILPKGQYLADILVAQNTQYMGGQFVIYVY